MNGNGVAGSLQALLDLVEDDRRQRRAAIESQCAAQAGAVLREARHAARARLVEAIAAERRRLREALEALDARLATEQRLAAQRRLRARLDIAWRELPGALRSRWSERTARTAWAASVCRAAADALERRGWRIVHAPGWPEAERAGLAAELLRNGIAAPVFDEDPAMEAGLSVHVGANTVDGTLRGLLADRAALGARLSAALALMEAVP